MAPEHGFGLGIWNSANSAQRRTAKESGLTDEAQHVTFSGQQIDRRPHEDLAVFQVRAMDAARAASARVLVVGELAN